MSERIKEILTALWLLLIFVLVIAVSLLGKAQNIEGQLIASQYGTWQVSGYAPDTYTEFVPTACRVQGGASFFAAFTVGTPVKIVDGNPDLSEVVTPTNVVITNNTCAIAIAPVNHHNLPFYLTSATGGLQEAINANLATSGMNTIILNNQWYQLGGSSSIISSVHGIPNLGLVDVTTVPSTFYAWNGSRYVEVSNPGNVTSVFGRTGVVTAQSGDYTCLEVTNCQPSGGLGSTQSASVLRLASSISATVTTIPLTSSPAALASQGVVVIDNEWIEYSGVSGDDLLNATRGYHQTTAASHAYEAYVYTVLSDFGSSAQPPSYAAISNRSGITWGMVFGCPVGDSTADILQIGCAGNDTYFDPLGGIQQTSTATANKLQSPVGIGPGGGQALITNSGYLFDITRQNQSQVPQGFGAGIAGPVESVKPITIAAPSIINFAGTGSTTWSYECTGTDVDGNTYPGTVGSITSGPASIPAGDEIIVSCPFSAGAFSEQIWRTAGGPNQGLVFSSSPQPAGFQDTGASATSGMPPSTNSTIPKICTAGEQYCQLSGTTSAPTVACSASTAGWTFHNVSATTSPFAYVCNATAWVAAY